MSENKAYLSEQKYNQLKEELEFLKTASRQEISQRIEEAKKLGDLSENAEYMEAREAQGKNEKRIFEIEVILKRASIIKKTKPTGKVQIGSVIKVKNNGNFETYSIVGSEDAEPLQGKVSNESPLGQALLDKKVGEVVEVETPAGKRKYTIVSIS